MFPRLEFRTSRDVNRQNLYVSFYLLVVSLNDTLNVKVLFLRTNFKIHIKIPPGVGNYLLEEAMWGVLGEARACWEGWIEALGGFGSCWELREAIPKSQQGRFRE